MFHYIHLQNRARRRTLSCLSRQRYLPSAQILPSCL